MRGDFVFDTIGRNREKVLKQAEQCPADKRGAILAGFNNHIHWHLGHIVTVADGILYGYAGLKPQLPDEYRTYFANGTKPAEWQGQPPSWEEVVARMREQTDQLRAAFSGKLGDSVKENFFKAETIEELLLSVYGHEANHAGNIHAMMKALG